MMGVQFPSPAPKGALVSRHFKNIYTAEVRTGKRVQKFDLQL